MRNPDTYRRFAGDCLRSASHASDPTKKGLYFTIATAWNTLADRAEAQHPKDEEPRDDEPGYTTKPLTH